MHLINSSHTAQSVGHTRTTASSLDGRCVQLSASILLRRSMHTFQHLASLYNQKMNTIYVDASDPDAPSQYPEYPPGPECSTRWLTGCPQREVRGWDIHID